VDFKRNLPEKPLRRAYDQQRAENAPLPAKEMVSVPLRNILGAPRVGVKLA
jgi:hypothetical protein